MFLGFLLLAASVILSTFNAFEILKMTTSTGIAVQAVLLVIGGGMVIGGLRVGRRDELMGWKKFSVLLIFLFLSCFSTIGGLDGLSGGATVGCGVASLFGIVLSLNKPNSTKSDMIIGIVDEERWIAHLKLIQANPLKKEWHTKKICSCDKGFDTNLDTGKVVCTTCREVVTTKVERELAAAQTQLVSKKAVLPKNSEKINRLLRLERSARNPTFINLRRLLEAERRASML